MIWYSFIDKQLLIPDTIINRDFNFQLIFFFCLFFRIEILGTSLWHSIWNTHTEWVCEVILLTASTYNTNNKKYSLSKLSPPTPIWNSSPEQAPCSYISSNCQQTPSKVLTYFSRVNSTLLSSLMCQFSLSVSAFVSSGELYFGTCRV